MPSGRALVLVQLIAVATAAAGLLIFHAVSGLGQTLCVLVVLVVAVNLGSLRLPFSQPQIGQFSLGNGCASAIA